MAGELKRLGDALDEAEAVGAKANIYIDPVNRVYSHDDLRTALDLLERAAGVMGEVQRITGHDYGSVWLADYRKAKGE
jgi:hypothetical protein